MFITNNLVNLVRDLSLVNGHLAVHLLSLHKGASPSRFVSPCCPLYPDDFQHLDIVRISSFLGIGDVCQFDAPCPNMVRLCYLSFLVGKTMWRRYSSSKWCDAERM